MEPNPKIITESDLLNPPKDQNKIGNGSTLQPVSGMNIDHGPKSEVTRTADNAIDTNTGNGSQA